VGKASGIKLNLCSQKDSLTAYLEMLDQSHAKHVDVKVQGRFGLFDTHHLCSKIIRIPIKLFIE
jgi:hypothetical protein